MKRDLSAVRANRPTSPKQDTGRPTKYTPELAEKICDLVRQGNYIETAAAACGVSRDTVHRWMRESARGNEPVGFSDALEKARGEAEAAGVSIINRAAQSGQWQAAAWRLERSNPERWGYKQKIEHSGAIGRFVDAFNDTGDDDAEGGQE